LKEQLSFLIKLQQIDSSAAKIEMKKKELPEKLAKLDADFEKTRLSFEEIKKKADELTAQHREKEDNLKKGQEALKKTKSRQFEVKTNKEYEAILKEIEVIEGKNNQIEDQIIVLLEEIDRSRGVFKAKEKEFSELSVQHEEERKKMASEIDALDDELKQIRQNTEEIKPLIADHLLKKYEAIKSFNNGIAVVRVWKEVCQGCHMNIPPQLYNELQKAPKLVICPNCNRIMYWEDVSKEVA
jgi:uncharacterized protein